MAIVKSKGFSTKGIRHTGEVVLQIRQFLTSAVGGSEWSASRPEAERVPEPVWAFRRREKYSLRAAIWIPDRTARNLITIPTELPLLWTKEIYFPKWNKILKQFYNSVYDRGWKPQPYQELRHSSTTADMQWSFSGEPEGFVYSVSVALFISAPSSGTVVVMGHLYGQGCRTPSLHMLPTTCHTSSWFGRCHDVMSTVTEIM